MKTTRVKTTKANNIVMLFLAIMIFGFSIRSGWVESGINFESYKMGIEKGSGPDGSNAATIESGTHEADDFGTLMQMCSPEKYSGKQIKMTGYLKSENVEGLSGLWLRVDIPGLVQYRTLEQQIETPVKGTSEWKKYEITLAVPDNATRIAYGALLSGTGKIWFDNISFEVLDNKDNADNPSSVTENTRSDVYNKTEVVSDEPVNLDFEN